MLVGKLKADDLEEQLAALLKMDRTIAAKGEQGNACMVAALVLTVAVLVQTRLEAGKGLHNIDVEPLAEIGTSSRPAEKLERAFNRILQHDYEPVFTIARDILCDVTQAGLKTAMLDAAIAGIIEQSRDAAEQYAMAGADYAGELFNRIMHDRASDGAYFTRPEAGALLTGLALHATDETDFTNGKIVDRLRVLDPACGSGTLLQAWLTAIKRKARNNGATDAVLSRMHRRIVEDALTGLDVNPVSIQLAGAMLMIGDTRVQYARMGLHTMPYGPQRDRRTAAAGSLELLRQPDVLAHQGGKTDAGQDDFFDDELNSFAPREATERALKARVVLTNPPFVTREKLGAKFGIEVQRAIRERIDKSQEELENKLPEYAGFSEKTTTQPLYLALGLLAMEPASGVLGTVIMTVGLLAPSGLAQRRKLASELHIRYVVTCHEPGEENLSQSFRADPVNESLVVGTRIGRNDGLPTTFVSLDRFPRSVVEAHALADAIAGGGRYRRAEVRSFERADAQRGLERGRLEEPEARRGGAADRPAPDADADVRHPRRDDAGAGRRRVYAVSRLRAPGDGFNAPCPERGCGHPRLPEQSGARASDDGHEAGHGRQDQENPGKRDGCRTDRNSGESARAVVECPRTALGERGARHQNRKAGRGRRHNRGRGIGYELEADTGNRRQHRDSLGGLAEQHPRPNRDAEEPRQKTSVPSVPAIRYDDDTLP